ncbi:glycosyl hydrolase family 28-related protein [Burkholderia contaminans]|uniref:glycosyl hydrolase family 28-related protein n=1 Tax=Burkholderia contaminans TaxID=488447 RepID=UPI0015890C25|nr:glycosyl hydrolase family 28-related protein [Burkholderia contaminans]
MASILPNGKNQFIDQNGKPLVNGTVTFYLPGTTTKKDTYQDAGLTQPNTNPVVLDSKGQATIWGSGSYRQVTQDALGVVIWDQVVSAAVSSDSLAGSTGSSLIGTPDGSTLANTLLLGLNRVVDSIAALRATNHTFFSRAFVTGYYAPHDGGGGAYQYDPNDTSSADNGGTIIVASDGGRWKLQAIHTVTIRQFGAKGDGTTDDTAAIQAGLNAGLMALHVPDGTFLVATGLQMPVTSGFVLFGNGNSSILKHTGNTGCLHWPTNQNMNWVLQEVHDLAFIGTTATANTVDTSYAGNITLRSLFFQDVPVNFASIYINGSSTIYTHDIRVIDLQVYSNTAGNASIVLGPTAADVQVINMISQGNFLVNYAIDAKPGAQSTRFSSCHVYNAKLNVVLLEGSNAGFTFDDCTLDNSLQDVAYVQNCSNIVFNNTRFQAIQSAKNGLTLSNCLNTLVTSCQWDGVVGANSCLFETGGTNATTVLGGVVGANGNFTRSFQISGAASMVRFVNNNNPFGMLYSFSGATTAPVPQNSSTYLGVNGAQSNVNNTGFVVPQNGLILSATIQSDSTPAPGQTFSFNLQVQGSTVGIATISNGSFSATITVASGSQPISQGNQVAIQTFMSATSGSANFRYFVSFSD